MHKILFFLYHPHKFSNEPKDRSCIEMPNQSDSTCRCKFTGFNVLKKATDSFYVVIYLLKKDENQSLLNRKKKNYANFKPTIYYISIIKHGRLIGSFYVSVISIALAPLFE
jgi:hypothetical protein